MDHSTLAELVDAIHVAVGLRLVAVVLYGPAARGEARPEDEINLLVIVDDDIPTAPDERAAYLPRRMPVGSLDGVVVLLKSPGEFDADPPELYRQIAAEGRVLLDLPGFVTSRFARLRT